MSAPAGGDVRLDKWLWAARLFKTRSLARNAVEAGHVRYDGERPKVGKPVRIGARLRIRRGSVEMEVVVRDLDDKRRGAPEAQRLYEETPESIEQREARRAEARASHVPVPDSRPDKKERRALQRLKGR
ncbi:RNA-binding S4 domain-containing protein [Algiphilus aromaticivorans]|jgi:ribosome-associated heat shock protein Hsp15|uniref:RNA-binding S4 domain-containing protein n=1 Tax=Algiphilus aromaticivorans TaxID=382454 RepID=UPI0005C21566|nr:S4 domain-containing protein [Algiphilus aromaticivorans]